LRSFNRASKSKLSLAIQYASADQRIPTRSQLRRWVSAALERDAVIALRIVDAKEGRELNRTYRKKDYATNVLTFVYSDAKSRLLVGDIVLCAPILAKEALAQKKDILHHYAHLVIHGALHLQGYDHEKNRDALIMEQREIDILERKRITNPYAI
jgi:probable rRNA maturation factor